MYNIKIMYYHKLYFTYANIFSIDYNLFTMYTAY